MRKIWLILLILIASTTAHAETYRVLASNLKIEAVNGPGFCNGIKFSDAQKVLLNFGYPESCQMNGGRNYFSEPSYEHMQALVKELNEHVSELSPGLKDQLIINPKAWYEYDFSLFIAKDI